MNVKDQCVRGSTDDLGANRGHWGPNPQVWEQAVHMPFLSLLHCCTGSSLSWETEKEGNFMTLVSFAEINLG